MEFNNATTSDELLAALPTGNEDDRWELKSAAYLEPQKRGELKRELGKQVSAFSNSGGGFLVFGLSNDRQIEPCEETVGRQPIKDFLATMVEQSVEYPIRHFQVHRIPLSNDPGKSVFVVTIEDSPAAPHQAKEYRIYYYRIDGHSKPAPHFHVELLRNRITKAVLKIVDVAYVLQTPSTQSASWSVTIALNVAVENISFQSAAPWGVHVKHLDGHHNWTAVSIGINLSNWACVHGEQANLLPNERRTLTVHLGGDSGATGVDVLLKLRDHMRFALRPVSHHGYSLFQDAEEFEQF